MNICEPIFDFLAIHNSFRLLSYLLMYFGSSYWKQYGPRSGSKPFDTLIEFLFKMSILKKVSRRQQTYEKLPSMQS